MVLIRKHMTRPNVKLKSAKIVTKTFIHILIFPTRIRKTAIMTTIPSPVNKVKSVFKTCPNIWRRLRRSSPPYKLIYQILNRNNPAYKTQMESHTQIHFFCWSTTTRLWNLKIIPPNRLYSTKTEIRYPCTRS